MYGSDVKTKDTNKYSSASKNAKRHFEDDQPCILSFYGSNDHKMCVKTVNTTVLSQHYCFCVRSVPRRQTAHASGVLRKTIGLKFNSGRGQKRDARQTAR